MQAAGVVTLRQVAELHDEECCLVRYATELRSEWGSKELLLQNRMVANVNFTFYSGQICMVSNGAAV